LNVWQDFVINASTISSPSFTLLSPNASFYTTTWSGSIINITTDNLLLDATSIFTVDMGGYVGVGTIYASGTGPGGAQQTGGAGHGGNGCTVLGVQQGTSYGSVEFPTDIGSSGGSSNVNYVAGGSGGGVIFVNVTNSFIANGTLTAVGGGGSYSSGGGSGGSILVLAYDFSGSGLLTANGGPGAQSGSNTGGGGGGGRIAVHYGTSSFSGSITAYGARDGAATCFGGPGMGKRG
jgi:hypothetical protein